jgi:hypothetical protein
MPKLKSIDAENENISLPKSQPIVQEESTTQLDSFIPIDNELLPTKGIFYNGKRIYGRTLKVIELKKLANISVETDDIVEVIDSIMRKVITGVDWDNIKLADKQALIFWIRCNTFRDPRFSLGYKCNLEVPKTGKEKDQKVCGAENKLSFSIEDLEYEYIDETKLNPDLTVTVQLPFSGDEIVWSYPTNKEVKIIEENYKKLSQIAKIEKIDEPDYELVSYACITNSINGNSNMNVAAKYAYFSEELSSPDYVYLESLMENDYACGIKQFVKATCSKCGGTVSVPVMFSQEFFNPAFTK